MVVVLTAEGLAGSAVQVVDNTEPKGNIIKLKLLSYKIF